MIEQSIENDGKSPKKVRRTKQLPMGILVPIWWRKRVVICVAAIAVASVIVTISTLQDAGSRLPTTPVAGQDSSVQQPVSGRRTELAEPLLPEEYLGTALAYEEALPRDLNEESPVVYPDADGPRITVQEEFVPQPLIISGRDQPGDPIIASKAETLLDFRVGIQNEVESTERAVAEETLDPIQESIDTGYVGRPITVAAPLWRLNAIAFDLVENADTPMIAIVMDDMGVDQRRSTITANLPGPLTLSYLTYAKNLHSQTNLARANGHELMLHVPMEPESPTVDPGPQVLKVNETATDILNHLRWGMSQFDGYVGINNHMGSKFTRDHAGMRVVLAEVKRRGLLFLDSRTAGGSAAPNAAQEFGVPFATRNVFLDHIDDEIEIRNQLMETERLARKNGSAIAIGHPRDTTISVISEWLETLDEKGITLAPVSAIIRQNWKTESSLAAVSDPISDQ